MGDPHGAVGTVDMLSASPGRAIGVDPEVAIVDFDFDRVVDLRIDRAQIAVIRQNSLWRDIDIPPLLNV